MEHDFSPRVEETQSQESAVSNATGTRDPPLRSAHTTIGRFSGIFMDKYFKARELIDV